MILSTYLSEKPIGSMVGTSTYLGREGKRVLLLCECGLQYDRNSSNEWRGPERYVCKKCTADRSRLPDWGFRCVYKRVRRDAQIRKLEFTLTLDEVKSLIKENCHYCNSGAMNKIVWWSRAKISTDEFWYNGIDRKDSSIGYVYDNCLPSCPSCNHAKGAMSYDDFLGWIEKLITYRSGMKV